MVSLRRLVRSTSILALVAVVGPAAAEEAAPTPDASATLPLGELLRLHRAVDDADRDVETPPPVAASIQKLEFEGRLLDGAVELDAHVQIAVLAEDEWVAVPLLRTSSATQITSLPPVTDAVFDLRDGHLHFLSQKKGTYYFEVSLWHPAESVEDVRQVSLRHADAALSSCRLSYDEQLFAVESGVARRDSQGTVLVPVDGGFDIAWRRLAAPEAIGVDLPPPAVESVIPVVHGSLVSTLEGQRIVRLLYELQLQGRNELRFELADGHEVRHVYLNGASVSFEAEGGELTLPVIPGREGGDTGTVELVLVAPQPGYHLSGRLGFELPAASWPTHELFLDLHLPQVFNYEWTGGSLSPVPSTPHASYSYRLPLPGKRVSVHQVLIAASNPSVTLSYAVDLEGHYFRP